VPENEVTLGEVYRAIVEVRQEQRDMRKDLVGRAEYESDQEGINRRFEESSKVHTVLEAKVAAVDTKVDAKVSALEQKAAEAEKEQRQNRGKWTFALVMAGVGAVLSFIGSVLVAQGGA